MKYVPVYTYGELSEEAQYNAQKEWEDTAPERWLIREWRDFIKEIKRYGLIIEDWDFSYYEYDFVLNFDYQLQDAEGLSAFKKLLNLYYEITLVPKVYKSKTRLRVSKFQQITANNWEYPNWIHIFFVGQLKELIQKKDLNNPLSILLNTAIDQTALKVYQLFVSDIDEFPDEAVKRGYFFFENGSRYYEDKEV